MGKARPKPATSAASRIFSPLMFVGLLVAIATGYLMGSFNETQSDDVRYEAMLKRGQHSRRSFDERESDDARYEAMLKRGRRSPAEADGTPKAASAHTSSGAGITQADRAPKAAKSEADRSRRRLKDFAETSASGSSSKTVAAAEQHARENTASADAAASAAQASAPEPTGAVTTCHFALCSRFSSWCA